MAAAAIALAYWTLAFGVLLLAAAVFQHSRKVEAMNEALTRLNAAVSANTDATNALVAAVGRAGNPDAINAAAAAIEANNAKLVAAAQTVP